MTGKLQNPARRPKRQVIIETTVELFRQAADVRKVSIEDIAEVACVSPTTIYNQFGTREALVIEAAKSLLINIGAMAGQVMRSDLPFDQKLIGIVTGKISLAGSANNEIMAKLLSQDKNLAPFIDDMFKNQVRPLWRDFLAEGKRQGYIDESLDAEVFLEYLDVIRAGFSARKELLLDWKQNMDKLEKLTNLVFYGFLKKDINLFGKGQSCQP
jgi:AcrR family transcriptional regulator